MRKFGLLATVALLAVVILASGVGTAAAEPQKNQIRVPVTCDNGQSYTLVINGMAKTGLLIDSTDKNIVITSYTVTYYAAEGSYIDTDTWNSGAKRDDILDCDGQVRADFEGIGEGVTADFVFRGFLTPG